MVNYQKKKKKCLKKPWPNILLITHVWWWLQWAGDDGDDDFPRYIRLTCCHIRNMQQKKNSSVYKELNKNWKAPWNMEKKIFTFTSEGPIWFKSEIRTYDSLKKQFENKIFITNWCSLKQSNKSSWNKTTNHLRL